MSIVASVFGALAGAIAGGAISYVVSLRVAKEQVEAQYGSQTRRARYDWYTQANALAEVTEADWYDVMNRREVDHDVRPVERFTNRRDELRDHAAKGGPLDVDEQVVDGLEQLAADLNHALTQLDSGVKLAAIERELHPTIEQVQETANQQAAELE
ncbi:hypothetical protein [Halomarina rubra]|uniref:Uncharacterized protein n=1 Tax=Halomarina rubra TaxID=2071873 RepID=A0ABD6ATF2_9EURY|nr:hypothetical protein [Halomarina rubra]